MESTTPILTQRLMQVLEKHGLARGSKFVPLHPTTGPLARRHPVGRDRQGGGDIPGGGACRDLRQATLLMASLFAEMKREQTQTIQRQNALMEILVDVFRDGRTPALPPPDKASPSPDASPAPKETPLQTPRMAKPGDEEALAKAHEWFLHRLHSLNKSGP